jgi:hypothetical protein
MTEKAEDEPTNGNPIAVVQNHAEGTNQGKISHIIYTKVSRVFVGFPSSLLWLSAF